MNACPVPRSRHSKRRGEPCGRDVVTFIAPGVGRCGYHNSEAERVRVLATRRALVETRELRDVPGEPEHDEQTERHDPADRAPSFDVDRFVSDELGE